MIEKWEALSAKSAYQLADVTKTAPQYEAITPRWFSKMLEWKALDSGIFRLNKVKEGENLLDVLCAQDNNAQIPQTFIDYEEKPREYVLSSVSAVIRIDTRVSDLYSTPHDQIKEQLRLAVESLRERQESLLINSEDYGLLRNIAHGQRLKTRKGYPTPDDMDGLLEKVWKHPSFFLAHPAAAAAFGRECTRRGVPPAVVTLGGGTFMTWRGIPIIPTDKLPDGEGRQKSGAGKGTSIALVRAGEARQGVIGLYQKGLPDETSQGLSVRFMGIDSMGVGTYLLTMYCSLAILTNDAAAVLEDVEVGHYYDYE